MPWVSVDPADLRHRVQIQARATGRDAFGQALEQWATIDTAWAGIRLAAQREFFRSDTFSSEVTHVITLRYSQSRVAIVHGSRIVFGTKAWKVETVDNVEERNILLRLLCIELDTLN